MRRRIGLLIAQCRVGPADEGGEVPTFLPGAWADGIAGPTFDREIARLQIHENRAIGRERPKQAGLALAAATKDRCLDAARFR